MRPALLTVAGLALLGPAAGAVWWWSTAGAARSAAEDRLRVLFTGETKGQLEPCHCTEQMPGGLPKRARYIQREVDGAHLLLDTGCVGNGARAWEILRTEAALRGMKAMGYDAANVGEHELWLGAADLREIERVGVPLVSANVVEGDTGEPAVRSHLLLERAGRRIAITGVVDDGYGEVGPGLRVQPPREALARLLPEMRREAKVVILLADLRQPAVERLASDFPELTLILFRGRGESYGPERVNRTAIASVYGQSMYIGDLSLVRLDEPRPGVEGRAIRLDDRFTEDPAVRQASIGWYKQAIEGRSFDFTEDRPGWDRIDPRQPPPDNHYVGSESCARCHGYQYGKWRSTAHAHAMETLEEVGYEWSPECAVCHTVGYGAPDGYQTIEATPKFAGVGCESCHDRGEALLEGDCPELVPAVGAESCRRCHNGKHDPDFNFERDWARIDHTHPAGAAPSEETAAR